MGYGATLRMRKHDYMNSSLYAHSEDRGGPSFALTGNTLRYPFVWRKGALNGYSSTRVSLRGSLMFGRLAIGFANVFGRVLEY